MNFSQTCSITTFSPFFFHSFSFALSRYALYLSSSLPFSSFFFFFFFEPHIDNICIYCIIYMFVVISPFLVSERCFINIIIFWTNLPDREVGLLRCVADAGGGEESGEKFGFVRSRTPSRPNLTVSKVSNSSYQTEKLVEFPFKGKAFELYYWNR